MAKLQKKKITVWTPQYTEKQTKNQFFFGNTDVNMISDILDLSVLATDTPRTSQKVGMTLTKRYCTCKQRADKVPQFLATSPKSGFCPPRTTNLLEEVHNAMISFFVSTLHSGQTIPNTRRQLYNKTDIGPLFAPWLVVAFAAF